MAEEKGREIGSKKREWKKEIQRHSERGGVRNWSNVQDWPDYVFHV